MHGDEKVKQRQQAQDPRKSVELEIARSAGSGVPGQRTPHPGFQGCAFSALHPPGRQRSQCAFARVPRTGETSAHLVICSGNSVLKATGAQRMRTYQSESRECEKQRPTGEPSGADSICCRSRDLRRRRSSWVDARPARLILRIPSCPPPKRSEADPATRVIDTNQSKWAEAAFWVREAARVCRRRPIAIDRPWPPS